MKRLSDYKDEQAIELWADLIDPLSKILGDKSIAEIVRSGKPKIEIAKTILHDHSKEAAEILLRIDDTPLDGFNIILRLMELLTEMGENEDVKSFFGFAAQAKTAEESSGLLTENTEAENK